MNASQLAQQAYAPSRAPIRSARDTEYDAFARATAAMKQADGPTQTAEALHANRELWTLLAGEVADGDNALPAPLRARIFYLHEFTHQHTSKVLAGKDRIEVLIDINTAVMSGLRGQGGGS